MPNAIVQTTRIIAVAEESARSRGHRMLAPRMYEASRNA